MFILMRSCRAALALGALAVVATAAASRAHWHDPHMVRDQRLLVIEEHAAQMPRGAVLLVGDSTAERFHLPTLCGLPVLNAGVGRASAEEVLPLAQTLKARLAPRLVIVSVGLNDADPASASAAFAAALGADFAIDPASGDRPDGLHPSAASYTALRSEIERQVCRRG